MPDYLVIGWDDLGNKENFVFLDAWDDEDARDRAREEVVQDAFWGCHHVDVYRLTYVERFGDPVHQREIEKGDDFPF